MPPELSFEQRQVRRLMVDFHRANPRQQELAKEICTCDQAQRAAYNICEQCALAVVCLLREQHPHH